MLSCTLFYSTLLYCAMFHYAALCNTMPYYTLATATLRRKVDEDVDARDLLEHVDSHSDKCGGLQLL